MKKEKITKYEMVMQYLQQYIRNKDASLPDKLPTEMQLVEALNVSRITVQRALHELQQQGLVRRIQGDGTYINRDETPKTGKNRLLIPIVLNNDSELFGSMKYVQGADCFLSECGGYLTVNNSHQNAQEEQKLIQRLIEDGFRCIIVSPYSAADNSAFYFRLMQMGIQFVFLDRCPESLLTNFVACDNVQGGYLATKHMIERGAKRIAFISAVPIETAHSLTQRMNGYVFALQESQIQPESELIGFAGENETLPNLLDKMLSYPEKPDAFVCANDITAIETLNHLQNIGVAVPNDAMIIGFDNLELAQNSAVPLSSIEQPFFQLGYEAAQIAKQILSGNDRAVVQKYLPVKLVVRESTAGYAADREDSDPR